MIRIRSVNQPNVENSNKETAQVLKESFIEKFAMIKFKDSKNIHLFI